MLVFTRTKHGANRLAEQLGKDGLTAAAIHGNKSQGARTRALEGFKSGEVRVLVATDIAARGLDIDQLPFVVNYELPNVPEDYVHRIGRTARAGLSGQAVSLVCVDELKLLRDIERLIRRELPKVVVRGLRGRPLDPGRADRQRSWAGASAGSFRRRAESERRTRTLAGPFPGARARGGPRGGTGHGAIVPGRRPSGRAFPAPVSDGRR